MQKGRNYSLSVRAFTNANAVNERDSQVRYSGGLSFRCSGCACVWCEVWLSLSSFSWSAFLMLWVSMRYFCATIKLTEINDSVCTWKGRAGIKRMKLIRCLIHVRHTCSSQTVNMRSISLHRNKNTQITKQTHR